MSKNGMIVILEGSEQCGKTTLARKIQDLYKAYYFHGSRPEDGDFLSYHTDMFLSALKFASRGHVVVLDRHFISHEVYGRLFDKGTKYDTHKMHRMMELMCEMSDVQLCVIFCNPKTEFDPEMRDEMYSDGDGKIKKAFEDIIYTYLKDASNAIMMYDWTRSPSAEPVLLALELIRRGEGKFLKTLEKNYN